MAKKDYKFAIWILLLILALTIVATVYISSLFTALTIATLIAIIGIDDKYRREKGAD